MGFSWVEIDASDAIPVFSGLPCPQTAANRRDAGACCLTKVERL